MQIGLVGLGRMGAGMAQRLAHGGVDVVCHDQAEGARSAMRGAARIECAENLAALCARLTGERIIMLMLPAGTPGGGTNPALLPPWSARGPLVGGGDSHYRR